MNENSLEELQIKVAFLEEALNKLSDEHYVQQQELEKLKLGYSQLLEAVHTSEVSGGQSLNPADEVPPHY